MIGRLTASLREWGEEVRFTALSAQDRSIVFYAENAASWSYFEEIVEELTGALGRTVCYLTSDPGDSVLRRKHPKLRAFSVGTGRARAALFYNLTADVLVMTMPDLETYQIKRSRRHQVHYVYVFHSMVSTHMIYRPGAFDNFDTILCVGPHHVREIRSTERLSGLPAKNLLEHGYGRLDAILATAPTRRERPADRPTTVLVAPSWGPHGLLETMGTEFVEGLLGAGHRVVVRPHPETVAKWPDAIRALRSRCEARKDFVLETDISSVASLAEADLMISDWSGAALEYAFGHERPVLFVDVPRKVNNPDYEKIEEVPIEVEIRAAIGAVVAPDRLSEMPARVDELCRAPEAFAERIRRIRSETVYNVGSSGSVGARHIARIADESRSTRGSSR